jgi:hypothetical protein
MASAVVTSAVRAPVAPLRRCFRSQDNATSAANRRPHGSAAAAAPASASRRVAARGARSPLVAFTDQVEDQPRPPPAAKGFEDVPVPSVDVDVKAEESGSASVVESVPVPMVTEGSGGGTVLAAVDGLQAVTIFGVSHLCNNYDAAEHILRQGPTSDAPPPLHLGFSHHCSQAVVWPR